MRVNNLPQTESYGSTGRLYSLDEVVADMDGMMDIPGPAADDGVMMSLVGMLTPTSNVERQRVV